MEMRKKGGVVGELISGTGGLIITVVVILVVVATLLGSNLLGSNTTYSNVSDRMAANFTTGIDNVSSKIPTILLIGAVVLLFGVIVLLVRQASLMGIGSTGGSL